MEKTITQEEMIGLLRNVQEYQLSDMGRHEIDIKARIEGDKLWFVGVATVRDGYVWLGCYENLSLEDNKTNLEKWMNRINSDSNERANKVCPTGDSQGGQGACKCEHAS